MEEEMSRPCDNQACRSCSFTMLDISIKSSEPDESPLYQTLRKTAKWHSKKHLKILFYYQVLKLKLTRSNKEPDAFYFFILFF